MRADVRRLSLFAAAFLLLAAAPAPARAQAPEAWLITGQDAKDYELERDEEVFRSGTASMRLGARGNRHRDDWAVSVQMVDATPYRGKRVRLSGFVRSDDVRAGGLWLRIDGIVDGKAAQIALDNMEGREVKGSKDWTPVEIVVDVTGESVTILYGAMVTGDGEIWVDDLSFEEVGPDVELTTDPDVVVTDDPYERPLGVFPVPTNLGFEVAGGEERR